ncbi:hypothetical protein P4V86_03585 [Brevibacillus laterosporus]|uniref:hypothetical protein n=1 Tax=Brevibacillus laterosporus TaxID=1465 RepID=UPI0003778232|nr:hypothetical protein [Brevibacillus laterosporus]ATO48601.1 hypothetical protein BrL25_05410 [Brevibacillus laterosporus DSM 25]MED2002440.1 hypothetical protein [Brevibacillus laterosporus]
MKKEILTGVLSVTLLSTGIIPAVASNNIDSNLSIEQKNQYVQAEMDKEGLSLLAGLKVDMGQYVTLGKDNLLHLDPEAKELIGEKAYSIFERGVKTINDALNSGEYQIQNNKLVKTDLVHPQFDHEEFWWGISLQYNNRETKELAALCEEYSTDWSLASALTGLVPGGQSIGIASAIMSWGNAKFARKLTSKNKGKGVNVDIAWVPVVISIYGR